MTTKSDILTLTLASGSASTSDDIQAWLKAATELAKHEDPERFMPLTVAVLADPQPEQEPTDDTTWWIGENSYDLSDPKESAAMLAHFRREWEEQRVELITDYGIRRPVQQPGLCCADWTSVATVTVARVVSVERENPSHYDPVGGYSPSALRWLINVEVTP